ncbi:MAG: MFS transporter [Gammaproteobacteria bacterium]|nr:MFS transporter [Gammaproteobacteria bacterium]
MSTQAFKAMLPRTVVVLSLVSLLNDAASEMITPLLPIFLTLTLGASPAAVGLIEGLAEATSSVLKLVSGRLADRGWNPKGLVVWGYGTSNLARPLIGIALSWPFVLALRFLDRLGKGLRTAPRDALIANSVSASRRGAAFGFHRAMDHFGAVIGPLVAFLVLSHGVEMRNVFLMSVVPGIAVMLLLVMGLPRTQPQPVAAAPLKWSLLDGRLRALIIASGGLALATMPEAFLVLWAVGRGIELQYIPLVWAAASLVKMFVSFLAGAASDRLGRLPVVITGWSLRIACLFLIAGLDQGDFLTWTLFLVFAASLAFTEAAERSLVGDAAEPSQRGTAFGVYHLVCGLLSLPGALLIGSVWQGFGQAAAFMLAGTLTSLAAAALVVVSRGLARGRQDPSN